MSWFRGWRAKPPVIVIGAGGHAKCVISVLKASRRLVLAAYDDDPATRGRRVLGVPILGPIAMATEYRRVEAVVAIGDNRRRRELAESLNLRWTVAVHPTAIVDPSVSIGPGVVIAAGAIVQPDVVIGEHAIVNSGAIVGHDCRIGPFAHVAGAVGLAGSVSVGMGTLVGIGSSVPPCVTIGCDALICAGVVVTRHVPDGGYVPPGQLARHLSLLRHQPFPKNSHCPDVP